MRAELSSADVHGRREVAAAPRRRSNDVGAEAPAAPPALRPELDHATKSRNAAQAREWGEWRFADSELETWSRFRIGGGRRTSFPEMAIVTASHFTGKRERPTHIDRRASEIAGKGRVASQIVMTTTSSE